MLKKIIVTAAVGAAVLAGTAAPASAGGTHKPKPAKVCTSIAVISILDCSTVNITIKDFLKDVDVL